jgi:transposase-like protein
MFKSERVTYSPAFKEKAVRLYLEGNGGYQKLTVELGLKDTKTLRDWVAKVRRGETFEDGRAFRKEKASTQFASVEEELAYVKAERDYLKKLYRSRFGHEWGAHKKGDFSK